MTTSPSDEFDQQRFCDSCGMFYERPRQNRIRKHTSTITTGSGLSSIVAVIPSSSSIQRQSTKEKIRPYFAKMASQTYIHGVKEIYESRTLHERLFWIFVCLTCLGAASYEIFQVVRLYKESGVATKISVQNVDTMRYPTVLFCPTTWLSKARVQRLRIEPEVINFTLSLLEPGGTPPRFQHIPNNTATLIDRLSEIVSSTRSESIAGLLRNLSLNTPVYCSCCERERIRQHVTLAGVCSVIDLCRTAFQLKSIPNLVYIVDKRLSADTLAQAPGGFISIFDNRSQIGISNHDTIFLTPNVPIRVKLSVTRIRRIPTAEKPCSDSDGSKSPTRCEFDCIDRIRNRLCYNCSKYGLFSKNVSLPQCGSTMAGGSGGGGGGGKGGMVSGKGPGGGKLCEDEDADHIVEQLLACKRQCVPPCTERVYTVGAVTSMSTIRNEDAFSDDPNFEYLQAEFLYTTFTETVFEDINTFNIDKFISSIGGQTGLWCGASVVSLCQLISYCCCPCLHWTHLRYSSIRRESSRGDQQQQRAEDDEDQEEPNRRRRSTKKRKCTTPSSKEHRSVSYNGESDTTVTSGDRRPSANVALLSPGRQSVFDQKMYNTCDE